MDRVKYTQLHFECRAAIEEILLRNGLTIVRCHSGYTDTSFDFKIETIEKSVVPIVTTNAILHSGDAKPGTLCYCKLKDGTWMKLEILKARQKKYLVKYKNGNAVIGFRGVFTEPQIQSIDDVI